MYDIGDDASEPIDRANITEIDRLPLDEPALRKVVFEELNEDEVDLLGNTSN